MLTTKARVLRAVPPPAAELLSVVEVARRLRVSTATVYHACERGQLRHVRILNVIRIPESALAALAVGDREEG